jgi:5-methylcytosine-specific restriction protein A
MKRTEIRRYTPLRAKAKLTTRSTKTDPSKRVVALVFDRDGGCCIRCGRAVRLEGRGEEWSVQHRRARGAGGDVRPETNLPANLVILCGSATSAGGCHFWAESQRDEARLAGLSMRWKQDPQKVPVSTWWGAVFLDDKGYWRKAEVREDCVCDPVLCVNGVGHCEEQGCAVCEGAVWTEVPS